MKQMNMDSSEAKSHSQPSPGNARYTWRKQVKERLVAQQSGDLGSRLTQLPASCVTLDKSTRHFAS